MWSTTTKRQSSARRQRRDVYSRDRLEGAGGRDFDRLRQAFIFITSSLVEWPTPLFYLPIPFPAAILSPLHPRSSQIADMESPEEAAQLGRQMQRTRPDLVRPDWSSETKTAIMLAALSAQFEAHAGPREMLLSTRGLELAEASPNDFFWGWGYDGSGGNQLGKLLVQVREEILLGLRARSSC